VFVEGNAEGLLEYMVRWAVLPLKDVDFLFLFF
jgi:hypothetical protein